MFIAFILLKNKITFFVGNFFFKYIIYNCKYVNFNSISFFFNYFFKYFFSFFLLFFSFIFIFIKNIVFFITKFTKINKLIKIILKLVEIILLKILELFEFYYQNKEIKIFNEKLKLLYSVYKEIFIVEALYQYKIIFFKLLMFVLSVVEFASLIVVNFFSIILKKYIWRKIKNAFWIYVEWEISVRKTGTMDDFLYNINEIKRVLFLIPYKKVYNTYIEIIKNVKLLYKLWKKKRPEKIYFFLLYYNIVWYGSLLLKNLLYNLKFTYTRLFFIENFKLKKIPLYVFLFVIFLFFLKYFKILMLLKLFSSNFLICLFLPFKSYYINFMHFFLKKKKLLINLKYKFRRGFIFSWIYFKNRFLKKFNYKKNYFYESNKYWRVRNGIYRWFLKRKYIDRYKVFIAEGIRRKCYIRKKRRLTSFFFKILPINFLMYLIDRLYNYDILLEVVDILRFIS